VTDADRPAFAEAIGILAETLGEPFSKLRIEGYWIALNDLPIEAVQTAILCRLKTATFFPKPAEIRAAIEGTTEDQAELAWRQVNQWIRSIGSYGYPAALRTDDVLCGAVEACGGWQQLCLTELDQMTYQATAFKRAFGAMARREQMDRASLPAWVERPAIGDGREC